MRDLLIALSAALFLLTGCSGGDDPATPQEETSATASPEEAPPVRGELEVSVEPLTMDELPDAPDAGAGVAVLDGETYAFTVTFCDDDSAIGSGAGDGLEVNWDVRDDGDHRVNIRIAEGEQNWVRGGPAEAEWDRATGTVRFAGAFVPFRARTGEESRAGGIVVVCPGTGGGGIAVGGEGA